MHNISKFSDFFYDSNLKKILDKPSGQNNSVLVFDYCGVRDIYSSIDKLAQHLVPYELHFVSTLINRKEWSHLDLLYGNLIKSPPEIWYNPRTQLPAARDGESNKNIPNIDVLIENLKTAVSNGTGLADTNIIRCALDTAYYFSAMAIRVAKPSLVLVWNSFHPLSQIVAAVCKQYGIPIGYLEYGALPGTLSFDFCGQMGESAVVQKSDAFNKLPICKADLTLAEDTLNYFKTTGINRKELPPYRNLSKLVAEKSRGRKVILYAGHNDAASGTFPYTQDTRVHHSPIFKNADEAGRYILSLARNNNWFVLYKPHPLYDRAVELSTGENCLVVSDYNINECIDVADVVATVLSQTSYVALIREKPVVMLGFNHLRHSGAIYQATVIEDVEMQFQSAFAGFELTIKRKMWSDHVARLLKYYLYQHDVYSPDEVPARSLQQLASIIVNTIQENTFEEFKTK
ncbi:hypothetical protein SAMN04488518_101381 [Pseudovibrio ascidiaceicola]|uniref:Capsule polysaccharide biosynthesis protein n=1 Tax=Pseudovibrio ascidiaceicola TaxID=285279 RepID=A0A1I3VJW1_9HYPH|nr:hypothetical protein [Pseudovibrio ascidiaceicola]SFJ94421.1 hypothetical protein SAMN04488518_101381 [Pseudovibrio ascidiaceicola]